MDKEQTLNAFWNSFGIPAYDEATVPQNAKEPYISYSVSTGALDDVQNLSATIWYRSTSWKEITNKKDEISRAIGIGGKVIKLDNGYVWITRASMFAQRLANASEDDMVRAYYLQLQAEFLTKD